MYFDTEGRNEPIETWREPPVPGSRLRHWLYALATIAVVVTAALALTHIANQNIERKAPPPATQSGQP